MAASEVPRAPGVDLNAVDFGRRREDAETREHEEDSDLRSPRPRVTVSPRLKSTAPGLGLPPGFSPSSAPRLFIVHQGAVGDLILAVPVLDGLARLIPKVRLDFWGRPELLSLLATKPYLGEVRSCDGFELGPFLTDDSWRDTPIPSFLDAIDALIVFGQERGRAMAEHLRQRLACPVFWIRSFPTAAQQESVGGSLIGQMRAAGWSIEDDLPRLIPPHEEVAAISRWFQREGWEGERLPVLIHAGSGGRRKIWPLPRWWRLIRWLLAERGLPVVLTLGPADDVVRPLGEAAQEAGAQLLTEVSLPRLAAVLSHSRLYIGNDSGVTHLAAAVGVPTIAIFGPASRSVWAPRGSHVQVIQSQWEDSESLALDLEDTSAPLEAPVRSAVERVLDG